MKFNTVEVCPSGQEDVGGVCVLCQIGFFKNNDDGSNSLARYSPCAMCDIEWITANVGSESSDACNIGMMKQINGSTHLGRNNHLPFEFL